MTADAGFLRAICETPDDDSPRLIYADWLEENGQPERAEFIRLQIADPTGLVSDNNAFRRQLELLETHGARWSEPVADAFGYSLRHISKWRDGAEWEWRRGFVSSVICSGDHWIACGNDVLAVAPVRAVRLTTRPRGNQGKRWIWFDGHRRWDKWGKPVAAAGCRLGGSVAEVLLKLHWPRITFTLPAISDLADDEQRLVAWSPRLPRAYR